MRAWRQWCLGLLLAGVAAAAGAQALQPVPKLESRVTDLTGTLTAGEQTELERKLASFEERKGAQVAVLLVATTAPEAIEQYSIRVADAWKLGRAKPDDGALLLLAKDDRALRIEVGYGLEGALTDATSNRIIQETMVPLLRQGSYAAAISAGVDQMIRVIDGEPLPAPDRRWQGNGALRNYFPFLIFGFFILSGVLRSIFGRPLGAVATGGAMGGIVWLLTQIVAFSAGAAAVAFLLSLIFGATRGWTSGPRGGGWSGGGFGGGGFGGGGFGGGGGFSGGGGGFGGGGASGRW